MNDRTYGQRSTTVFPTAYQCGPSRQILVGFRRYNEKLCRIIAAEFGRTSGELRQNVVLDRRCGQVAFGGHVR